MTQEEKEALLNKAWIERIPTREEDYGYVTLGLAHGAVLDVGDERDNALVKIAIYDANITQTYVSKVRGGATFTQTIMGIVSDWASDPARLTESVSNELNNIKKEQS